MSNRGSDSRAIWGVTLLAIVAGLVAGAISVAFGGAP